MTQRELKIKVIEYADKIAEVLYKKRDLLFYLKGGCAFRVFRTSKSLIWL